MSRFIALLLLMVSVAGAETGPATGLSALIYGKSEITVKTRTQGEVVTLGAIEGQKVKRGELIAQIDDRQERIDKTQAESEYLLAKEDWEKTTKLKKYVSGDDIKQKQANFLKKKSVFELKSLDIEKKRVLSPIDGVVTRVYFERGETVSSGDKFAEVVQMDDLYLVANVPSGEALQFKQGTEVTFKVEGQKTTFRAKVIFTSPVIDASSDTIRVKLEAKNERTDGVYALKPGMVATLLRN